MGESENLDVTGNEPEAEPASQGASADESATGPQPSVPPLVGASEDVERRRRRDKVVGLGIVAAAFGVSMLLSLWAKHASTPPISDEPAPPTTVGLEGFPSQVDPWAVLPLARGLTDRPLFRGFVADKVQPNGLMDFSDTATRLRFSFQSLPGQGAQPERPAGTLPSRAYCGRQSVSVRQDGIVAEPDKASFPCPSTTPKALPDPRCRPDALWKLAKKKGATDKRPARIEYYESKKGPAYRFSIPGTKHRFVVAAKDCKRELKGKHATGTVP
jgi:hypothetical protein